MGKGVAPFAITWGDSLAKFAPSVCGLCSAGQEILMPKGENVSTGRQNNGGIELEVQTAAGHFGTLVPVN